MHSLSFTLNRSFFLSKELSFAERFEGQRREGGLAPLRPASCNQEAASACRSPFLSPRRHLCMISFSAFREEERNRQAYKISLCPDKIRVRSKNERPPHTVCAASATPLCLSLPVAIEKETARGQIARARRFIVKPRNWRKSKATVRSLWKRWASICWGRILAGAQVHEQRRGAGSRQSGKTSRLSPGRKSPPHARPRRSSHTSSYECCHQSPVEENGFLTRAFENAANLGDDDEILD